MYGLIFEKKATESFNKLEPQIKERIWNKLQQCKENPFRFLEHLEEINGFHIAENKTINAAIIANVPSWLFVFFIVLFNNTD